MKKLQPKSELLLEIVNRFKDLPVRTIARYVLYTHGELFDYDYDAIRTKIRHLIGSLGEKSRKNRRILKPEGVLPRPWRTVSEPYVIKEGKWLVISDIHIPFHDKGAIERCIDYAKRQRVNGILINGDLQDYVSISYWKDAIFRDFDKEYVMVIDFLAYLRGQFPKAKIVWKPGNHERRLPLLYVRRMPEMIATPLLAMEVLLGLEEKGIELLDVNQLVYMGELPVFHGHEIFYRQGINPARVLFMRTKSWGLMSHAHQTSQHSERNLRGEYLTTWSTGCLCNLNPHWNPYGNNWNHGFAIVEIAKDGFFLVHNKRILPTGEVV